MPTELNEAKPILTHWIEHTTKDGVKHFRRPYSTPDGLSGIYFLRQDGSEPFFEAKEDWKTLRIMHVDVQGKMTHPVSWCRLISNRQRRLESIIGFFVKFKPIKKKNNAN
jgi:hypothetical protein